MHEYLRMVQPDAAKWHEPADLPWSPSAEGMSSMRLAADLPDGRSMTFDMPLVNVQLGSEGPAFDAWYDGLTRSGRPRRVQRPRGPRLERALADGQRIVSLGAVPGLVRERL